MRKISDSICNITGVKHTDGAFENAIVSVGFGHICGMYFQPTGRVVVVHVCVCVCVCMRARGHADLKKRK